MIAKPEDTRLASLESVGLQLSENDTTHLFWNLTPADLYEHAVKNGEARLTDKGALRVLTGQFTGRSPKDKFFVEQSPSKELLWWGTVNLPISIESFDRLHAKVVDHL